MDRLLLGLSTTGVGMLVVFSGLVILIACIYIMTSITGRKKAAPKRQAAPAPAPAPVPAAEDTRQEEDDLQLAAVITAAIAAVWQQEGHDASSGFVVRRIRRAQSSTARARAARDEQIYSRL